MSDFPLAVALQVSAGAKMAGQGCGWPCLCRRKPELSPAPSRHPGAPLHQSADGCLVTA